MAISTCRYTYSCRKIQTDALCLGCCYTPHKAARRVARPPGARSLKPKRQARSDIWAYLTSASGTSKSWRHISRAELAARSLSANSRFIRGVRARSSLHGCTSVTSSSRHTRPSCGRRAWRSPFYKRWRRSMARPRLRFFFAGVCRRYGR